MYATKLSVHLATTHISFNICSAQTDQGIYCLHNWYLRTKCFLNSIQTWYTVLHESKRKPHYNLCGVEAEFSLFCYANSVTLRRVCSKRQRIRSDRANLHLYCSHSVQCNIPWFLWLLKRTVFRWKLWYSFIFDQNIDCRYSLELPHSVGIHNIFLEQNLRKIMYTFVNPSFFFKYKSGVQEGLNHIGMLAWWNEPDIAYAKTKTQISCAVTAQLISAFVFAMWIVQSLHYRNPKFQASSHLLWLYIPVCVRPGRKPRRPVFSQRGSYMLLQVSLDMFQTSYLPSNINMMTLAGILSSVLKWDFSCSKDWPRVHARVTTWPLGIRTNFTENRILNIYIWESYTSGEIWKANLSRVMPNNDTAERFVYPYLT